MINKFFKIIHNKYPRFFEFVFFLRYLILLFVISLFIFLSIPVFFDYEKRAEIIKRHLVENYKFEINDYEKIKYNILPLPSLELINVQINLKFSNENLSVKKIKVYPNILNIYNYKNFNSNKIILKNSNITFQISNFKFFIKQFISQKHKLSFENLNLRLVDKKVPVFTLKNIQFANYGYKKNLIRGKVFEKNFKVRIGDNYKNINFNLLNSGINTDIIFNDNYKKDIQSGIFKSKILNTNFKSNFEYDGKTLRIYDSYFRSKNLSFKNESEIIINPFLDINSKIFVEEFNTQISKKVDFTQLNNFKEALRKINSKSEITFKPKKFNRKFFDDLNLKINLAYGRMNYSKTLSIEKNIFQCEGSINFLEEYPVLFFDCYVEAVNKKELLKKFSIRSKNKDESFELNVKGNFSILNRKVNFKKISINEGYNASKEDLKYFKETFEKIFLNKKTFEIFDLKKIKKFIIEIS